jgi:hypothetical protein
MYSPGSPTSWADTFPGTLPMPHVNTTADPRLFNTACDNVPSHIIYISHIGSSILHYHPFFSSTLGQSRHRTAWCFSCPQSPTTTSGKTRLRQLPHKFEDLRTKGPKDPSVPTPAQAPFRNRDTATKHGAKRTDKNTASRAYLLYFQQSLSAIESSV